MNNYIKTLAYLKCYEGDGNWHNIENVIELSQDEKRCVFYELAKEGYIHLKGGYDNSGAMTAFSIGNQIIIDAPEEVHYFPFEAKITFSGSKYLKEELNMNKGHNITIGSFSGGNFIIDSQNISINEKEAFISHLNAIIEEIKEHNNEVKEVLLPHLIQLKEQAKEGKIDRSILNTLLEKGSNIASIVSLFTPLIA